MATPPFDPAHNLPGDTDIVAQFPAVERTFRDVVESWILSFANRFGLLFIGVGTTATRNSETNWSKGALWCNTSANNALEVQTAASAPFSWKAMLVAEDIADLVPETRTINTGIGLLGGGDLSANRTLSADRASGTEAIEGTDNTKVMTPFRVAQAIDALGPEHPSTASTNNETVFPIGHTVLVITSSATFLRNAEIDVKITASGANNFYVDAAHPNAGADLQGTWRARGAVFTDLGTTTYLAQRVA